MAIEIWEWLKQNITIDRLASFASRIVIALIILFLGLTLGKFLAKLITRVLHEIELDNLISKTTKIKFSVEKAIGNLIKYLIYFVTLILVLNQLGITTVLLYIIMAFVLAFILILTLFGVKDFIPNLFAGFMINKNKLFKKGDTITFKNTTGKVIGMNLTETRIKTKKGDILFIPNSALTKSELIIKEKPARKKK